MRRMLEVDQKIFTLIDALILNKVVQDASQFCDEIGLIRQTYNNIKNGRGHFGVKYIKKISEKYNVNANWIFGSETKVFNSMKSIENKGIR